MAHDQLKFLITGTGDLIRRMKPTWDAYNSQGIQLIATDIIDDPTGRSILPSNTAFFNISDHAELRKLLALEPFDVCFLSNYPSVHVATALRFDFFSKHFIFPKPVDSHLDLLRTMKLERDRVFRSIVSRMKVHDHYRNKPLVSRLRKLLQFLHGKHGFVQEIRIYITERRSTEDEWFRKGALDDGLILDLAPHAMSVLHEILPQQFSWQNADGHFFSRKEISFNDVVACYRARDNNCILKAGAETFAAIDLRGEETLIFRPRGEEAELPLDPHEFRILIVVGKGTSIDNAWNRDDLKAIEITFDGNTVTGNFDTNAIGGVVEDQFVDRVTESIDRRHRGLNLPFLRLAASGLDMSPGSAVKDDSVVRDFQEFDDAYQIIATLSHALAHKTARELLHYETGIASSDLINRLVGRGLDARWQLSGPLTHLVIGASADEVIA